MSNFINIYFEKSYIDQEQMIKATFYETVIIGFQIFTKVIPVWKCQIFSSALSLAS